MTEQRCYHCHSPVPAGGAHCARLGSDEQRCCCAGCAAAAETIHGAGLAGYYRQRDTPAPRVVGRDAAAAALYDHPALQARFVQRVAGHCEASVLIEGATCPACLWLIERRLGQLPGLLDVQLNFEAERAALRWREGESSLAQLIGAVQALGYGARPWAVDAAQRARESTQRELLKRAGVAGLLGMQVMLLAVAVYLGDWLGMEPAHRQFINAVAGLLTVPVFVYCGAPFLRGARRSLAARHISMDVPVSVGLCAAMAASALALWRGEGAVYFDSVVMFCFFLLLARHLERRLHARSADAAERLAGATPALATRLGADGSAQRVASAELAVGDRLLVAAGEPVPADAVVERGESAVDESLLSGESLPRPVGPGDALIAGSLNTDQALTVRARAVGADSTTSQLARLLERAAAGRPAQLRWAERLAGRFCAAVLLIALATALYWWWREPARAAAAAIAVLVVSCPCALALAVPSALGNATSALARHGLLLFDGAALASLASLRTAALDKTGTLSTGELQVGAVALAPGVDRAEVAALVAALERDSRHPVALALQRWAAAEGAAPAPLDGPPRQCPGRGVLGRAGAQEVAIGTPPWLRERGLGGQPDSAGETRTLADLAVDGRWRARFAFSDRLRSSAAPAVRALAAAGVRTVILSGDRPPAVAAAAAALGVSRARGALRPADKLAQLRELQSEGPVMMVGDGLNDAAVLAGAHIAVAMGTGSALALQRSDAVLASDDLELLPRAVWQARRARRTVRQNLAWALCYNALAMPLAVSGVLAPWMAAVGMSASSLVVVANAARLQRLPRAATPGG